MPLTPDDLTPTSTAVELLVRGRGFTADQIARAAAAAARNAAPQILPHLVSFPSPPLAVVAWVARGAAARLERHEARDEARAQAHLVAMLDLGPEIDREIDRMAALVSSPDRDVWRPI
jgi:hypothetical protein